MKPLSGYEVALVGLFAALTAVGAFFSLNPGSAVPFTLQVLFTLLAGALLGSRLGAYSQATYVLMGLVGLPVFAMRRAGFGVLLGPTGGFLVGFIVGAWIAGWVMERGHRDGLVMWRAAGAMLLGLVGIYVPGIAWLSWHVGGVDAAVVAMLPHMPLDLIKAAGGVALIVALSVRGIAPTLKSTPGSSS